MTAVSARLLSAALALAAPASSTEGGEAPVRQVATTENTRSIGRMSAVRRETRNREEPQLFGSEVLIGGPTRGSSFATPIQRTPVMSRINQHVAGRLEEAARLLQDQGADRFRVGAYLRAASSVRAMQEPLDHVLRNRGLDGLKQVPHVGETIARAIRELLTHGRLPMLDRLRGEADPVRLLASVPGVGRVLSHRLHEELGLETLADLEAAAHDGRLATIAGFGSKRLAGVRDSLAHRLGRVSVPIAGADTPSVSELLDVDREYRERARTGDLQRIAPRRFNPSREAWLPVLHTRRGARRYTALFSNTARAHQTGNTRDWVVLYGDNGAGEHRHTVITAGYGPLRGRRVVAGREDECRAVYLLQPSDRAPATPPVVARTRHMARR